MASDKIFQIYSWELSNRIATLEELEPNEIFTAEIQEIVNRTLETLPEQTRRIFAMSRYENKSHKEIADLLNMTTKGVEYHINKATKVLRIALKDYLPTTLLLFFLN
jgi:RNA polymerase sigma-70 factor (ECF subfamily)